ncbi:hypothetical protein MMC27_000143 [Xylographa pallens]|nr:hypothetical protein [Xylographa pallens]
MPSPSKFVLVTGTSKGSMGSALAASFGEQGFITFATARDFSKVDASLSSHPNVHTLRLDVTSVSSIAAALETVAARTDGKLDYLINNAGGGHTMPLADVDLEAAKKVFDVNFWGVLSMTKMFVPLLVKSKGTVVNISSIGAVIHAPWIGQFASRQKVTIRLQTTGQFLELSADDSAGIYSASKAALTIASETLRVEVEPLGVRVITAMIGCVETNIYSNNSTFELPAGSLYKPIKQQIADTNARKHSPKGTDVNTLAKNVVDGILKGKKGQLWRGKMASMTSWVSMFVHGEYSMEWYEREQG